jgi:hypothetical protein
MGAVTIALGTANLLVALVKRRRGRKQGPPHQQSERTIETATASHLAGPPERHRSTVRDPRFSWLGGAGLGLERCLILTSGTALQRSWD